MADRKRMRRAEPSSRISPTEQATRHLSPEYGHTDEGTEAALPLVGPSLTKCQVHIQLDQSGFFNEKEMDNVVNEECLAHDVMMGLGFSESQIQSALHLDNFDFPRT